VRHGGGEFADRRHLGAEQRFADAPSSAVLWTCSQDVRLARRVTSAFVILLKGRGEVSQFVVGADREAVVETPSYYPVAPRTTFFHAGKMKST